MDQAGPSQPFEATGGGLTALPVFPFTSSEE